MGRLFDVGWIPDLHPRDPLGQFRDVPDFLEKHRPHRKRQKPTQGEHSYFSKKRGYRVYHRSRKEVHDGIIKEAIYKARRPTPGQQPTATMLVGGPGTGKNYLMEHGLIDVPEGTVVIDPDWIKEQLPEYKRMVAEGNPRAANLVHSESQDVAKRLQYVALKLGYDVTLVGTGAWTEGEFTRRVKRYHRKGYKVKVVYVNSSVVTALRRNRERGRDVGEGLVRELHRSAARRLPEILAAGTDEVTIWDNDGALKKIAELDKNGYRVLDEDMYDAAFAKGDAKL